MSAIALVDCNNFYVSCERLFNPELIGRPVAILSNNDGCIVARSNELKALNVPMGVPIFEVRHIIDRHNVTVLSSNYELYADISSRVMNCLDDLVPDYEQYSVDEMFLRFPTSKGLREVGKDIRSEVKRHVGIPVSIGISTTKTLAKVSNRVAKKGKGVFNLFDSSDMDAVLNTISVSDIWGIGPAYSSFLSKHGINTALELRDAPDEWIKQNLTVVGLRTARELRGEPCIPFEPVTATKKSITCSRSFGVATDSYAEVKAAIASFTSRAVEKLRASGLVAGNLEVFVATDRFKDNEPQYSNSTSLSVAQRSDSTIEL